MKLFFEILIALLSLLGIFLNICALCAGGNMLSSVVTFTVCGFIFFESICEITEILESEDE